MADPLTCSGCQKRYLWKAQYAGRKVQCRCGQYLIMPAQDPAMASTPPTSPASQPGSVGIELQHDEPARAARPSTDNASSDDAAPLELAMPIESAGRAPNLPSQAYLQAMSSKPSAVAQALMNREDEVTPSLFKDRLLPTAVAIVGIITQIVLWFVFASSPSRAMAGSAVMLLAEALLMAPIALAAVVVVAKVMDIGFGPMVPALIKIVAIAIGAGGVADLLFFKVMLSVDFDYQILLVGFVLHMILIGIPVAIIFELESVEMAAIVSIIVLPRIAILYGMGLLFPQLF